MCLAIPGIIKSIYSEDGLRMAKVSFNGVVKNISIEWVPESKVGDFILVHAGSALSILKAEEAEETLDIFRQIASH